MSSEKLKTDKLSFTIQKNLKDEIKDYAQSRGLSVSSYIRSVLIKDLENSKERAKNI